MKKNVQLLIFTLIITIQSCGPSITITDSWAAPDASTMENEKLLVMARMDDNVSRQRFEQEIANQLRAKGIDAIESYKMYPSVKLNEKVSDDQIDDQIVRFKKDGIEGIVLTVVKDVKTEIITRQSGGYVAGGYYPSAYGYYGGFDNYYGSFYSPYGMGGTYIPSSQRTYESEIYKLETVIYDLKRDENRQLVAVVSSNIKDPKSASEVAGPYAKKVLDQFKKQ